MFVIDVWSCGDCGDRGDRGERVVVEVRLCERGGWLRKLYEMSVDRMPKVEHQICRRNAMPI